MQIDKIPTAAVGQADIEVYMARLDKIHPLASGNKYYKLKPNLHYAKKQGFKRLLSFGGAYSNHIHALALFAQSRGFQSIGIIRGEAEYANNPTLQDAQQAGMLLQFVDRKTYRQRHDETCLKQLQQKYPDAYIIPEGGSNTLALSGCAEFMQEINNSLKADVVTVACGTGATLAGISSALQHKQRAVGYAILKDSTLQQRLKKFLQDAANQHPGNNFNKPYQIKPAAYGGYAKINRDILKFILDWLDQTGILLDPVYTGKMAYALMQEIKQGKIPKDTRICMIHSGGLQGWRGMKQTVIKLCGEKSWDIISKNNQS